MGLPIGLDPKSALHVSGSRLLRSHTSPAPFFPLSVVEGLSFERQQPSPWAWVSLFQRHGLIPSPSFFFLINLFVYLFIFGCVGSSLLPWAFSSCGEQGLLIVVASLVAEHGL